MRSAATFGDYLIEQLLKKMQYTIFNLNYQVSLPYTKQKDIHIFHNYPKLLADLLHANIFISEVYLK